MHKIQYLKTNSSNSLFAIINKYSKEIVATTFFVMSMTTIFFVVRFALKQIDAICLKNKILDNELSRINKKHDDLEAQTLIIENDLSNIDKNINTIDNEICDLERNLFRYKLEESNMDTFIKEPIENFDFSKLEVGEQTKEKIDCILNQISVIDSEIIDLKPKLNDPLYKDLSILMNARMANKEHGKKASIKKLENIRKEIISSRLKNLKYSISKSIDQVKTMDLYTDQETQTIKDQNNSLLNIKNEFRQLLADISKLGEDKPTPNLKPLSERIENELQKIISFEGRLNMYKGDLKKLNTQLNTLNDSIDC